MPEGIVYRLRLARPQAHLFSVALEIAAPAAQGQTVSVPAWIPGSYMIRDFARNVVGISAHSGGEPVAITKLDKQTWQCAACDGALRIDYEVYANDLSVRGAHFDGTRAFFNGTSVFLKVHGQAASAPRGKWRQRCRHSMRNRGGSALIALPITMS
jgi:predicted metalloprotease with PDZ domain